MKKSLLFLSLIILGLFSQAQPLNYYGGTQAVNGTALKAQLHNIIDDHLQFQYSTVKQILRQADEDPNNPDNLILIFTGWSIPKANFAVYLDSVDYWNREHIWAKSHGDFGTDPGPGTDCHALKPVDNTVNSAKSNKDYDDGGTQYFDNGIPTGCYTDGDSWEPIDSQKGDIARMIFYMDARYEGDNGELDLTVVDQVNTYPNPTHGKLSTLLQWHQQDPVDDFERRRNDVIYQWQKNRNPFIDYPEFVNRIWGSATANPIIFTNAIMNPTQPQPTQDVLFSIDINSGVRAVNSATLYWGYSWATMVNSLSMSHTGSTFSAQIPGQPATQHMYLKIVADDGTTTNYTTITYQVANYPFSGTITPIIEVQGTGAATTMAGQSKSVAGIVTAAFGADFFIQSGQGPRTGIYIYNSGYFPTVGDSVIVTGQVSEYYGKTEVSSITDYYFVSSNNPIPDPIVLTSGQASNEDYESVLVKLVNAQCVRDTAYGMWIVNDGTGDCLIHNSAIYTHPYTIGSFYDIIGVMNYDFDQFKIELRGPDDVEAGTDNVAPYITDVTPVTPTIVYILFNEKLSSLGANTLSNYSISNGVTISNAMLHSIDNRKVILTVTGMSGGNYTLTVNNLQDLAGNVVSGASFNFSYLGAELTEANELMIYPNPANEAVEILLPESFTTGQVQFYDLQGRLALEQLIPGGNTLINIPINHLKSGLYLVKLSSEKLFFVNKLMVK